MLYYNPKLDIRLDYVDFSHEGPDNEERQRVTQYLLEDIPRRGLINPLFGQWANGIYRVHPGRCRCHALLELGIYEVPAVMAENTFNMPRKKRVPPEGWQHVDNEVAARLFHEDASIEWSKEHFVLLPKAHVDYEKYRRGEWTGEGS